MSHPSTLHAAPAADTAASAPYDAPAFIAALREALIRAARRVADPDAAACADAVRDQFLAEAADPEDRQRRLRAWDRAQAARRAALPVQ